MPDRTDIRAAVKALYTGLFPADPAPVVYGATDADANGLYTLTQGSGTAGDLSTIWENENGWQFKARPSAPIGFYIIDPDYYGPAGWKACAASDYPWDVSFSQALPGGTVAPTPAAVNVYTGRRRAIPESALPAIYVYVEQEEKQRVSLSSSEYERTLTMISEIHVQAASTELVKSTLDALCTNRETILLADETLGGLVGTVTFSDVAYEIDEENRRPAGAAICRDQLMFRA